jgi:RNA polymerase sigma factor (sigma-70 family)
VTRYAAQRFCVLSRTPEGQTKVACAPVHPEHGSGDPLKLLLVQLEAEYDRLLARLTRALRSADAASEALHDAYVKLESGAVVGEIKQPLSYLYRMAINLAKNRRRHEMLFTPADAAAVVGLADDAPDSERAVGARQALARVFDALETLPAQRRDIFLAAWRDEKKQAEIAAEFRLHKRTVQKELARAERYLRTALCGEPPRDSATFSTTKR